MVGENEGDVHKRKEVDPTSRARRHPRRRPEDKSRAELAEGYKPKRQYAWGENETTD